MSDEHQVNTIIATVISDARKDHPDGRIDPEEAKQIAKCITEALSSAGLQIVPLIDQSSSPRRMRERAMVLRWLQCPPTKSRPNHFSDPMP